MKSDRFLQGILVSDEDELFSYPLKKHEHGLNQVIKKLRKIKKNFSSIKYVTHSTQRQNSEAIFSKTTVDGNVEEAIADVWDRLRDKHDRSEDV